MIGSTVAYACLALARGVGMRPWKYLKSGPDRRHRPVDATFRSRAIENRACGDCCSGASSLSLAAYPFESVILKSPKNNDARFCVAETLDNTFVNDTFRFVKNSPVGRNAADAFDLTTSSIIPRMGGINGLRPGPEHENLSVNHSFRFTFR